MAVPQVIFDNNRWSSFAPTDPSVHCSGPVDRLPALETTFIVTGYILNIFALPMCKGTWKDQPGYLPGSFTSLP